MPNPLRTNLSLNRPTRNFSTLYNFVFHNIICCNLYFLQAEAMAIRPQTTFPHSIFSKAIQILLNFLVLKFQNQEKSPFQKYPKKILLNFLVLKFQNQEKSPFQKYPKTIILGVISFLLYCFAYDYQRRRSPPPRSAINQVINHCMLLLGYTTIASLVSLLFPDWVRPAIYVFYITLSVGELLYLVYLRIRGQFIRGAHFEETRNLPFLVSPWRVVAQRTLNQRQLLPR